MTSDVIARWNAVDASDPLPSLNDVYRAIGVEPQQTRPGDRFAVDREVEMYWPIKPTH